MSVLTLPLLAASGLAGVRADTDALALEPVVVISTRSERPVSDVAALVDLINASELAAGHVSGFADLGRYHVGIEAESGGTRFGANGLSIRGIGGNRVAMELDGVPVSDQFDIGSYSNAGRQLLDPELLSRVEVLRGPASSLYGSDAIGGVVGFFSWRAEDLARTANLGHRLRMGYDAASNGNFASLVSGWSSSRVGLVAGIVGRRGDAPDHSASSSLDDPVDTRTLSAMLKVDVEIARAHQIQFAASAYESDRDSILNSPLGYGRFQSTTRLEGDDNQTRYQLRANWTAELPQYGLDTLALTVAHQRARTEQLTFEERASIDQRYTRDFFYHQETNSARLTGARAWRGDSAGHRLAFGLDLVRVTSSERRDSTLTALDASGATNVILGEVFPLRDFPTTRTQTWSLWLQDEVEWHQLTLIPSLRYDEYRLRPERDVLYLQGDPAVAVVSVDDARLTPRLGALWQTDGDWTLFGQYAAGFRAPPFEDVNVGLDLPLFNIRALPNPDLESETSQSIELGARFTGAVHALEVSVFHNRYRKFIETRVPVGVDPLDGATLFQSRNVERATIEGAELRYRFDPQGVLVPLVIRAQLLALSGKDNGTDQPLASVSPNEALVGVAWQHLDESLQIELIGRAVRGARAQTPDAFVAPGYAVLDLLGTWAVRSHTQLHVGLLNLTDRTYWPAQSVRNLNADDPMVPLLSAPGRSLAASVEIRF